MEEGLSRPHPLLRNYWQLIAPGGERINFLNTLLKLNDEQCKQFFDHYTNDLFFAVLFDFAIEFCLLRK